VAMVLLLATGGCAGHDFTRPPSDALFLGKTTEAEIRQRLGDPYREGTVIRNGETMKSLTYAYASGAASLAGGVTPARGQSFYFWNGVLVGHDFTSSFDEDRTDFDMTKIQQIRKGETTEAGVVGLLGQPQGVYTYPLIPDRGDRAIVYLYSQTRGPAFNLEFYRQQLVVTLDGSGLVADSQFTSSGKR